MNRTLYRVSFRSLCVFVIAADDMAQARMFYRTRRLCDGPNGFTGSVGDKSYWGDTEGRTEERKELFEDMAKSEMDGWEITILGTALDSTETYVI